MNADDMDQNKEMINDEHSNKYRALVWYTAKHQAFLPSLILIRVIRVHPRLIVP